MVGNGLLLVVAFVWLGRGPGVRTAGRAAAVPCGGAALAAVGSAGQRVDALPVRLGCSAGRTGRAPPAGSRCRTRGRASRSTRGGCATSSMAPAHRDRSRGPAVFAVAVGAYLTGEGLAARGAGAAPCCARTSSAP